MLRFLRIKRLAVIDAVEVEFDPGLNVLTGETGAGKSILVEAVGLLLGGRASGDLVRTGEEAATIEAIFDSGGEELLVRREITAQGRSRAFVNGALATAGALKELAGGSDRAARPARASDAARPGDPSRRPRRLRRASTHWLRRPRQRSTAMRAAADELARVRRRADATATRARSSRRFSSAELDARRPQAAGEDEELAAHAAGARERRARRAAVRGELRLAVRTATTPSSRGSAASGSGSASSRRSTRGSSRTSRRATASSRSSRISRVFLRRYADGIEASPARLQQVEERLALLERLKRKYGPTLADVHRAARRAAARAGRSRATATSGSRELERAHARPARALPRAPRDSRRGAGATRPRVRAARSSSAARRAGDGAHAVRGAVRADALPEAAWTGARDRPGRVLRVAESRARISGRSRASCPAASCRASCWRSRR